MLTPVGAYRVDAKLRWLTIDLTGIVKPSTIRGAVGRRSVTIL
jgi:hypothetical protein